jgi:hypothetical protein
MYYRISGWIIRPFVGSGICPDTGFWPNIRYPAFRLTGYPAKPVFGASLPVLGDTSQALSSAYQGTGTGYLVLVGAAVIKRPYHTL